MISIGPWEKQMISRGPWEKQLISIGPWEKQMISIGPWEKQMISIPRCRSVCALKSKVLKRKLTLFILNFTFIKLVLERLFYRNHQILVNSRGYVNCNSHWLSLYVHNFVLYFRNKEFLPKEYCKVKGIEKKIFQVSYNRAVFVYRVLDDEHKTYLFKDRLSLKIKNLHIYLYVIATK